MKVACLPKGSAGVFPVCQFLFLLVFFFASQQLAQAQCPAGDITLLTQAEVDQFALDYPTCTTISGYLNIGPSTDIVNLNALGSLTQINQSLTIKENENLTDMSGLSGLVSVYRSILITNNPLLLSIDLEDVSSTIIEDLQVENNAALTTLAAPINLATVGSNVYIVNNPNLANLTGLENLGSIGRRLRIINTLENDFPNFSNLTAVGTEISIVDNQNVITLNFQNVSGSLGTDFSIQRNNALINLYAPNNLTTIGGNLYIATNPNLTHLTGLENVTTVGNLFRIGNTLEDNFPDFSNLTSVGRDIVIFSNQNLTSVNFQNVAGSLQTDFSITDNPALVSLAAPINLTSIGSNLTISNNSNLAQITGLENLASVGLRFVISHTLEDNFPDFSNLTSVGRLLAIGLNPNVTYLNFQNVSGSLTQSFQIAGNHSLIQVDAPINLTAVGEDLTFSANPNLTTINGVENVVSIGQYLYIDQNGIVDLPDFSSVTSVGRAIYIAQNPNITSVDIRNVNGVIGAGQGNAGIFVVNNSSLSSLAAPEPLSTVNGFISINANPNLSTFTGLGNVNYVGRTLWLSGIAESPFPDMLNLSTIGEDLVIVANTGIENLNWLANLVSIGGDLRIQNNPLLSNCTISAVCDFLAGTGDRAIAGNTGCCLNEPILTDACQAIDPEPLELSITGPDFCPEENGPLIGLNGSVVGISYQLQTETGTDLGSPIAGTGAPISFGVYPNGAYQVVATGDCIPTIIITGAVNAQQGVCAIAAPNFCSCNAADNRAPVTVKIKAPEGQNWTVKAVIGLYDAASPPAPGAMTPLAVGTPLSYIGGNMYILDALRRTDKGYWVQVTNGTTDKDVMVGNAAW